MSALGDVEDEIEAIIGQFEVGAGSDEETRGGGGWGREGGGEGLVEVERRRK